MGLTLFLLKLKFYDFNIYWNVKHFRFGASQFWEESERTLHYFNLPRLWKNSSFTIILITHTQQIIISCKFLSISHHCLSLPKATSLVRPISFFCQDSLNWFSASNFTLFQLIPCIFYNPDNSSCLQKFMVLPLLTILSFIELIFSTCLTLRKSSILSVPQFKHL